MGKLNMFLLSSLLSLFSCSAKKGDVATGQPTDPVKNVKVSPVETYSFRETGTMAEPNCEFKVVADGDSLCSVTYYNHDDNQTDTVSGPVQLLDEISNIVAQNKLDAPKTDKPEFEVLDGYSWDVEVVFKDGSTAKTDNIDAKGIREIVALMRKNNFKGL